MREQNMITCYDLRLGIYSSSVRIGVVGGGWRLFASVGKIAIIISEIHSLLLDHHVGRSRRLIEKSRLIFLSKWIQVFETFGFLRRFTLYLRSIVLVVTSDSHL